MKSFRDFSIKQKLITTIFLTAGGTVLLVGAALAAYEVGAYRRALVQQMTTQAKIVGINGESALLFNDERAASETLAALRAEPQIAFAGIYRPDGRPFAVYHRAGAAGVDLPESLRLQPEEIRFGGNHLELTQPIGPESRRLGTVLIRADLTELRERILRYVGIVAGVLTVSLVVCLLIALSLQKTISEPVLELVKTARTVAFEKNYSVRASARQHDELGVLVEAFNEMLDQVQRAEGGLRASEERYRLLFESNPQPLWVFDEVTLAFLAVNEAACRHYGYAREEFLAMTIRDIRPKEDVPALLDRLATESKEYQKGGLWRHRRKDGTFIEVQIDSHPLSFDGRSAQLVLAHDVTERRQLEDQLRQSQKMEAIGQLAGGVAHDFNNLLTVIVGHSELLMSSLERGNALRASVEEIRTAGERAASLTRQLLAFSRKQVLQPKVLDLNFVVREMERMLRRLIGEHIRLVSNLRTDIGRVRADPGQIEQVVLNLAVNARDAMPGGGTLTIETANADLTEGYATAHVDVRPGHYVLLAVSDTGIGMDADTKSHIFEPFFTTKAPGKGTGLGLATTHGIVKQSDGIIWVYSEPGRGTTFKIYLPRVDDATDPTVQDLAAGVKPVGSETLLLVEDEDSVRGLARAVLERQGYSVLTAASGVEALVVAARHNGAIAMLITDAVMPGMSGRELSEKLRDTYPEMRVLVTSGYTDDAIVHHGVLGAGVAFLQKPFTPGGLSRKVREVLDSKSRSDEA